MHNIHIYMNNNVYTYIYISLLHNYTLLHNGQNSVSRGINDM